MEGNAIAVTLWTRVHVVFCSNLGQESREFILPFNHIVLANDIVVK
jgi:hypothetical protein